MRKRIILLIFVCIASIRQILAIDNYFPLAVGNFWEYQNIYKYEIFEDTLINNITYYKYGTEIEQPDYFFRWDQSGKLYAYSFELDDEYLWFDFNLNEGDTCIFNDGFNTFHAKLVADSISVETPWGVFDNCKYVYSYIPNTMDTDKWYYFAPNVGIVKMGGAWMGNVSLTDYNVSAADQYKNDLALIKSRINFNDASGGFYSDYFSNAMQTFFCGAEFENLGMVSSTNVALRISILNLWNDEIFETYYSDTIEVIKPGEKDTINLFGIGPLEFWACKLKYEIFSDSIDENINDNQEILPEINLWDYDWTKISRTNQANNVKNINEIDNFKSGDFIGITLKTPPNTEEHASAFAYLELEKPINGDVDIWFQIFEDEVLVDSVKAQTQDNSIFTNSIEGMFYIRPEINYYVGFKFVYNQEIDVSFKTDTANFHNFASETIAKIDNEWKQLDFIPLIRLDFDPEGIDEKQTNLFQIFPNPMQNQTIISSKENQTIQRVEIFDIDGRLVRTFSPDKKKFQLDREGLKQGIYFVQCSFDHQITQTVKLIINP